MKKLKLITLSIFLCSMMGYDAFASNAADSTKHEKTLFEAVTKLQKKNDLINVSLNTKTSFNTALKSTEGEKAGFKVDYLRLQIKGNITDRISFMWMQHLNRNTNPNHDKMPSSIDCLGVGYQITPTLSTFVGKQYADFGGFEYDANPADVYDFSDYGSNITCFLVGAHLVWNVAPAHELRFQIVNGRNHSAEDTYGVVSDDFKEAKLPLGYTFHWNSHMAEDRLLTRCSYSVFHEGDGVNNTFLALAAGWKQDRFSMFVDALYAREEIDKAGMLSNVVSDEAGVRAMNAEYTTIISRWDFRPTEKLNLFVKGMYETSRAYKENNGIEKGTYRMSYGYQGGMEYFPMKQNFRLFLAYHAKDVHYTSRGKALGFDHENTQYLSMGLTYNIPLF